MFWKRNNQTQSRKLNMMAWVIWDRRSKDTRHQLAVEPVGRSWYTIYYKATGQPATVPMKSPREVRRFIRSYFENLLYNGSGAPDDIFLDSMKSITQKEK
jgi:hypothetical protein